MEIKQFDVVILKNGKSGIVALIDDENYHISIDDSDSEEIIVIKKKDIQEVIKI